MDNLKPEIKTIVEQITESFIQNADPEKATQMSKYMKNKFDCLGIVAPKRVQLFKDILENHKLNFEDKLQLTKELLNKNEREFHYCAIELLKKQSKQYPIEFINFLEQSIITNSWWDSVDAIAVHWAGGYFAKYPEQINKIIPKWMESDNMWLQRTCLIFQLNYKSKTDFKLLKSNILKLANSNEFFIKKAIGWALRGYSITNPEAILEFVNQAPISNFSKKEALRLINKK
jgi:3-methyladenine DNA glycosylase AlkD